MKRTSQFLLLMTLITGSLCMSAEPLGQLAQDNLDCLTRVLLLSSVNIAGEGALKDYTISGGIQHENIEPDLNQEEALLVVEDVAKVIDMSSKEEKLRAAIRAKYSEEDAEKIFAKIDERSKKAITVFVMVPR